MAKINQKKIDIIIGVIEGSENGIVSRKQVCLAAGLNPRYKSLDSYLVEIKVQRPELNFEITDDTDSVTTEVSHATESDAEMDAMLGEDEVEAPTDPCPKGKTDDECCGDPENCSKKEPVALPPSTGIKYVLINDKGLAVPLTLVKNTSSRVVLQVAVDELVDVEIQGVTIKVNITQLRATGKDAEADFYLSQKK